MSRVGDDADLASRVADGVNTAIGEGHGEQRCGLSFTGGEQHVHFASGLRRGNRVSESDQIVGGLAHGGHDDHDIVAALLGDGDVVGNRPNAIGIGDGCAAVFLNDQCHEKERLLAGAPGLSFL